MAGTTACFSSLDGGAETRAKELWGRLQGHASWAHFDDHAGIRPGGGSHGEFIQTQVNALGAAQQQALPAGTLIIKANYASSDPSSLESYVAMERVPGYDPRHQDWFYAEYTPRGKVTQAGAPARCIACHRAGGAGDYVFYNDR
ncbi:MAG: hypothetical protein ACI8QC_000222 [Planctomycetota bacterium]